MSKKENHKQELADFFDEFLKTGDEEKIMGIQKLLEKQSQKTLKELEGWIVRDKWLAMRAVAAGVAEPSLLKNKQIAREALELHKKILDQVLTAEERKSMEFKTLVKWYPLQIKG